MKCFQWILNLTMLVLFFSLLSACGSDGCWHLDKGKVTTDAYWSTSGYALSNDSLAATIGSVELGTDAWSWNSTYNIWVPADDENPLILRLTGAQISIYYCEDIVEITNQADFWTITQAFNCSSIKTIEVYNDTSDCTTVEGESRTCDYSFAIDETIEAETIFDEFAYSSDPVDWSSIPSEIKLKGSVDVERSEDYVPESTSGCTWVA